MKDQLEDSKLEKKPNEFARAVKTSPLAVYLKTFPNPDNLTDEAIDPEDKDLKDMIIRRDDFTTLEVLHNGINPGEGVYSGRYQDQPAVFKTITDFKIFKKELQYLYQLKKSPHIVQLLKFGTFTERSFVLRRFYFMVLEYMPQTLARLLDKQGEQLPWPVRLQIAIDLTSVFKFLVGKIFYRDLKSANILLDSDSRVVLADFGSATLDNKTYYQNHVGTPGWLAPEIMRGEKYTSAVDVFGLGRIFLHLLFPALSIKAQHLLSEEQILSKEKCPPGFAEICVACCREEPNERPNRDTVLSWLQMINDQKVEVKERFSLLLSPLSRFLEHFPGPDSSQKPGGFKNMVIPYEGLEFYSKRKEGDPAGKRYKVFLNNTTEGQLRLKWINSDRFAEFKHEVKILSWLRTTQAVGKLKRFGTDCQSEKDGAVRRSYFIVTEYTEQTLQTELKSKGSSWPSRLNIALNIAKNIKEIGEMHIVHRNINPNNIWLTLDLLAKLTDFDHAVINNETITDDKFATSDGVAPEKLASPAMDVFSFGRVMLDLLTQNPPSNIEDGPQHLLKLYLTCRYTNPAERLKIDDAISQLEATINPKPTLSLQENKPNSSSFLTGTTNLPQSKKISSSPEDSKHKDQLPKTPEVTSTNSMPPKKLPLHEKVELSIFGKIPSSKGSAKQLEKPPSQGCLVC